MFKVKRFYKTVFLFQILFQILCNALSFILWFQQFNSFIIKLIFFFFFWLFSVSDNVLVSSLVRFIYNILQFFFYCCNSCRILSKMRRCAWMFCVPMSKQWKLLFFLMWDDSMMQTDSHGFSLFRWYVILTT